MHPHLSCAPHEGCALPAPPPPAGAAAGGFVMWRRRAARRRAPAEGLDSTKPDSKEDASLISMHGSAPGQPYALGGIGADSVLARGGSVGGPSPVPYYAAGGLAAAGVVAGSSGSASPAAQQSLSSQDAGGTPQIASLLPPDCSLGRWALLLALGAGQYRCLQQLHYGQPHALPGRGPERLCTGRLPGQSAAPCLVASRAANRRPPPLRPSGSRCRTGCPIRWVPTHLPLHRLGSRVCSSPSASGATAAAAATGGAAVAAAMAATPASAGGAPSTPGMEQDPLMSYIHSQAGGWLRWTLELLYWVSLPTGLFEALDQPWLGTQHGRSPCWPAGNAGQRLPPLI